MANILPLLGCQLHVNSTPTRRLLQITLCFRNSYAYEICKRHTMPTYGSSSKTPKKDIKRKENLELYSENRIVVKGE